MCLEYLKSGFEAVIEDDVSCRFESEELEGWNLMTRTSLRYELISLKLTLVWIIGIFFRYMILLPIRIVICFIAVSIFQYLKILARELNHFKVLWFVVVFTLVGLIPNDFARRNFHEFAWFIGMHLMGGSVSANITFHNQENRVKHCGLFLANHTTPFETAIMAVDSVYSFVKFLTKYFHHRNGLSWIL